MGVLHAGLANSERAREFVELADNRGSVFAASDENRPPWLEDSEPDCVCSQDMSQQVFRFPVNSFLKHRMRKNISKHFHSRSDIKVDYSILTAPPQSDNNDEMNTTITIPKASADNYSTMEVRSPEKSDASASDDETPNDPATSKLTATVSTDTITISTYEAGDEEDDPREMREGDEEAAALEAIAQQATQQEAADQEAAAQAATARAAAREAAEQAALRQIADQEAAAQAAAARAAAQEAAEQAALQQIADQEAAAQAAAAQAAAQEAALREAADLQALAQAAAARAAEAQAAAQEAAARAAEAQAAATPVNNRQAGDGQVPLPVPNAADLEETRSRAQCSGFTIPPLIFQRIWQSYQMDTEYSVRILVVGNVRRMPRNRQRLIFNTLLRYHHEGGAGYNDRLRRFREETPGQKYLGLGKSVPQMRWSITMMKNGGDFVWDASTFLWSKHERLNMSFDPASMGNQSP
ncbi:hypothetical protein QAD02_000532 [Eretmocerus hayati]|uniref:Uncharacterized protein n=1 Tax=Eretmocerus hayati TaxID=131215 RepID=A0ACC2NER6_9HYME|nr:hypothetical protein QAD02_000532 [Eretmocerus hayati]